MTHSKLNKSRTELSDEVHQQAANEIKEILRKLRDNSAQ